MGRQSGQDDFIFWRIFHNIKNSLNLVSSVEGLQKENESTTARPSLPATLDSGAREAIEVSIGYHNLSRIQTYNDHG